MLSKKLVILFLSLIFIPLSAGAADIPIDVDRIDGGEGHGGDPLRKIFRQAKEVAADKVTQLKECDFPPEVSKKVVQWILARKIQISEDILNSRHVWLSDLQETCAFTRIGAPEGDIYLSFPSCRPQVKNAQDAAWVLVHESSHHLGIEVESDADEIADAVMAATIHSECRPTTDNPWNPNSCRKPRLTSAQILSYFQPGGSVSRNVGAVKLYQQTRQCNTRTNCAPWKKLSAPNLQYYTNSGRRRQPADSKGEMSFLTHGSSNTKLQMIAKGDVSVVCSFSNGNIGCSKYFHREAGHREHSPLTDKVTNSELQSSGYISSSCIRLSSKTKTRPDNTGTWMESEVILFGTIR